jgi:hypothetical protein
MVRNHYKVRLQPLHFIFILAVCVLGLLVVYGIRLVVAGGRDSSSTNLMSREASRANEIHLAPAEPKLPPSLRQGCPSYNHLRRPAITRLPYRGMRVPPLPNLKGKPSGTACTEAQPRMRPSEDPRAQSASRLIRNPSRAPLASMTW